MKTYLAIIKANWQRMLTYRFTILAYRIGEVIEIIILILMWSAIYSNQDMIKGFSLKEMLTYVLFGSLVHILIKNFVYDRVSEEIKNGKLSLFLIKPISYLGYTFALSVGQFFFITILSVITHLVVILFFIDKFILNFETLYLAVILIMVILAFIIEFLIAYLIGLIAFWTDETTGIYATISRLKKFFSGGYFPISLLPSIFVSISLYFPFAYSFFVPSQIYLKKISIEDGLKGLITQIVWIVLLYLIIKIVWKKGIKKYEGVGI